MRWAAILAGVAVLAAAALFYATMPEPMPAVALPAHEADLENGERLFHIGGCLSCHAPSGDTLPSGGAALSTPVASFYPPNLTPDPETGIGAWSDAEIARAIREGIRPDGSLIRPPMPYPLYHGIADDDLMAIVAYLRSVPPVRNEVEVATYTIPLPPAWTAPIQTVAAPDPSDQLAWGAYLAGPIGHCTDCHTPMGEGGHRDFAHRLGAGGFEFNGPWGTTVAANITPAGLGDWSDAAIERAIRDGIDKDGNPLLPPMGFAYYKGISEGDMAALIAYLRSLPAVE